jgi:hypothetical protein
VPRPKEMVVSSRFGFGLWLSICSMVGSSGTLIIGRGSALVVELILLDPEAGSDVDFNISI